MHRPLPANTGLQSKSVYKVTLVAALATVWLTEAMADIPHGKLAASIRSSGQPCARVIEWQQTGEKEDGTRILRVRCNSGPFEVTVKDGVPTGVKPL